MEIHSNYVFKRFGCVLPSLKHCIHSNQNLNYIACIYRRQSSIKVYFKLSIIEKVLLGAARNAEHELLYEPKVCKVFRFDIIKANFICVVWWTVYRVITLVRKPFASCQSFSTKDTNIVTHFTHYCIIYSFNVWSWSSRLLIWWRE